MPRLLRGACSALALLAGLPVVAQAADPPELGLMGTIPVYWGEADDLAGLLAPGIESHWARPLFERHGSLRPLDRLDGDGLDGLTHLVLAQPRGLTPGENVALDAWVRQGGVLLLFADPMLTGESHYALGDPRRPQDVILLSPILRHWGLDLRFADDQPHQVVMRELAGTALPVNLPGQFALSGTDTDCTLESAGILASCRIGKGRIMALADAALLDLHEPHPAAPGALAALLDWAFAPSGGPEPGG
jgi:hypothetical protein